MRRTISVSAACAAAVLAILVLAVRSDADDSKKALTIDLRNTAEHVVDAAPPGDSAGDLAVLAGEVVSSGEETGQYQGYCVYVTSGANSQCTFTLALPGGQLIIATGYGEFNGDAPPSRDPIVGGSGDYSDARGYAAGEELADGTIRYVLHLEK